jgi:CheY-like chemotaxis protein
MPEQSTKKRIFIVEDDSFLSDLLARKFSTGEFNMLYAQSGEKALEMLTGFKREELPDLILLDIRLPGMDGFEVLRAVKKDEKTTHIPVFIFSNFGQEEDIAKSKELGASQHLVKVNTSLSDVADMIKQSLGA